MREVFCVDPVGTKRMSLEYKLNVSLRMKAQDKTHTNHDFVTHPMDHRQVLDGVGERIDMEFVQRSSIRLKKITWSALVIN